MTGGSVPVPPSKLISDTVFLAGITLYGYWAAFNYHSGRFDYFSLPSTLVELSLTNALISITASWLTVYSLVNIIYVGIQGVRWTALKRSIFIIAFVSLFSVNSCLLFRCSLRSWGFILVSLVVVAFFEFLWPPIFSYPGTYQEKLEQNWKTESSVKNLIDLGLGQLGSHGLVVALLLFVALPIIKGVGYSSAANQIEFPIYPTNTGSCAVVDFGREQAICVAFDEKNSAMTGAFLIVPINSALELENKKIGPLKQR